MLSEVGRRDEEEEEEEVRMLHSNRVTICSMAMQMSKGHEAEARHSGRESRRASLVAAVWLTRITASRAVRSKWMWESRYSMISLQAEMQPRVVVPGKSGIGDEVRLGGVLDEQVDLGVGGLRRPSCCRCSPAREVGYEVDGI